MSPRFMAMFAAVAMLLGVMLTVVTGHFTGAARDWSDANFGLSSRASILVVQSGVDAELSSTVNSEALSLLTHLNRATFRPAGAKLCWL
ncbi:MAG: hypothetical protein QM602_03665 [Microbacterium sp.]